MTEWIAYNEIEPIGAFRQDYGFGLICSTMLNMARSVFGAKDKKEITPLDFIPWLDKPEVKKPKQTVEQMKAVLVSIARAAKQPTKKVRRKRRKK